MLKCLKVSTELQRFSSCLLKKHQKITNPFCSSLSLSNNPSKTKFFTTLQPKVIVSNSSCSFQCRQKSKSRRQKRFNEEEDSDESDVEDEDNEVEDLDGKYKGTEVKTYSLETLRVDSILKKCFNYKRKTIEESFYKMKIKVNEKTLMKKSGKVSEGDVVDLVLRTSPDNPKFIYVRRLEILKISDDPDTDNLLVKIQKSRSLLRQNYPGDDAWKEEESE